MRITKKLSIVISLLYYSRRLYKEIMHIIMRFIRQMIGKDSIESVLLYLKVLFKYTIMILIHKVVETTRFT